MLIDPRRPPRGPQQASPCRLGLRRGRSRPTRSGSTCSSRRREEDRRVERHLGIEIPTREEMADIEPSEILYRENDARYMTARILCQFGDEVAEAHRRHLHPDREGARHGALRRTARLLMFMTRATKPGGCRHQPEAVLDGLIETIIDRAAEMLRLGRRKRIDTISRDVFETERAGTRRAAGFRAALIQPLGRKGDIISNVRESMVSVERLLLFLSASMPRPQRRLRLPGRVAHGASRRAVDRGARDVPVEQGAVHARRDARPRHHRAERHHQAVLGRCPCVFLPPTLIASIYGMNFKRCRSSSGTSATPGDRADDRLGRAAVPVLSLEEVAVGRSAATAGSDAPIR